MITGYPGPRLRRPPGAALELPPRRWGYMHKIDGACVRIRLDGYGRIASTLSRAGRELPEGRELHGIVAGPPDSILWAELECHTEAGIRAAATRGYRVAWLWDAERLDGRDLRGHGWQLSCEALEPGDVRGNVCKAACGADQLCPGADQPTCERECNACEPDVAWCPAVSQ